MSDDHADDKTRPDLGHELGSHARVLAIWEGGSASCALALDGEISVGRAVDCELRIDHGSVSRHHARLLGGSPVRVVDLGSSNGVRVRGEQIQKGSTLAIFPGDVVELGAAVLVVQQRPQSAERVDTEVSDRMVGVQRLIDVVAPTDISVLIIGETGVGKNVAATQIHERSPRRAAPIVKVNCAALPEALLEGELFGYERGAFTGAQSAKAGLIESADGGTVFFDEIGELPLSTQAKLLSVLESREVQRLGRLRPVKVDVRFLAATNRDLPAECARGGFRADLFYRLSAVTVLIPPLRERGSEILGLARQFVAEAAERWKRSPPTLSPEACVWLGRQPWPGNIRELKNALEGAILLTTEGVITPEHFGTGARSPIPAASTSAPAKIVESAATEGPSASLRNELEMLERQRIIEALEACAGNQTHAAERLGMSRRAFVNRLEQYGIPRPRKRSD